jgi:glycosyltransferase involved in cell wall biosynthesis
MPDRVHQDSRRTVIHIITQFDRGGSAMDTFRTVLGHDRRRFRACLVYGYPEILTSTEAAQVDAALKELRQAGVALVNVPALVREIRPLSDVWATITLWRFLRQERPSIVHTHTSKAGAVGRIAAWFARVPVVIHTPHGHVFYGYYGRVKSRLVCLAERLLAKITDRIITLTDRGAQEHTQYGIARREKFATIPSGIALQAFRSVHVDPVAKRKELGLPPEDLIVGTVGRLVPVKGHAWLLKSVPRVLAEVPQACFALIGEGPLAEHLRQLAEELAISRRVMFLGARQDVPECLAALDLFVLPSLNEGMGLALVEAMAMGLPVVATRVGGIPDVVREGETGLLVPPGDEKALALAMLSLLRDPDRRRAYGEAAKRRVDERFDAASTMREVERLYETVWREKQ